MYKIDRRGGGVQKSYTRTDPRVLATGASPHPLATFAPLLAFSAVILY